MFVSVNMGLFVCICACLFVRMRAQSGLSESDSDLDTAGTLVAEAAPGDSVVADENAGTDGEWYVWRVYVPWGA